jgi:hypothetical protein
VVAPISTQPKHALAQFAATGCFNGTYYADAENATCGDAEVADSQVNDNVFLAKLAVYSRERAFMKDMPAALTATLAARDTRELLHKAFDRVIDNGRVLRTLFQMIRSGQFGKKSLVELAAAGVPAVAEHGLAGKAAVGVDWKRSKSEGHLADGTTNACRTTLGAPCSAG